MSKSNEKMEIERLFIAEYENAQRWTAGKKGILSSIKENDYYLIFRTGKDKIPSPIYQKIIEDMGQHKIVLEAEILGNADYLNFIEAKIRAYASPITNVYFLDMESVYDELKSRLEDIVNVQSCRDFKVGRRLTKKKTIMKTSNKPNINIDEDNSEIFSTMNDVINSNDEDNIAINIEDVDAHTTSNSQQVSVDDIENDNIDIPNSNLDVSNENIKDDINQDINENASENIKEKMDSIKDENNPHLNLKKDDINNPHLDKDISDSSRRPFNENIGKSKEIKRQHTPLDLGDIADVVGLDKPKIDPSMQERMKKIKERKEDDYKQPSRNNDVPKQDSSAVNGRPSRGPRGNGTQGGGFGQKKPQQKVQGDTPSIQELERQIFGGTQVTISFDKTYTELDDEKAKMVELLMKRLIENINKLAKKVTEYDFNHAKYLELITTLVKSIDYNDFLDSWDIMEPGYPLNIDEKTYSFLYDEAQYYSQVCEMLYENDNWA
jgi:hypothetical protein